MLRRQKGGSLTKQRDDGPDVVSIDIDGCCVTWQEVKA
jgi:hypothetical protein